MASPAGGKCGAPTSQHVRSYLRAKRKRKAKPKAGGVYYVVVNERTGHSTGTRHRSLFAAARARKRLDLESYRRGQGRPYNVQKRST